MGTVQTKEYVKGHGKERELIDRGIVLECPNYIAPSKATAKKISIVHRQQCENLANAIIITAAKDYRKALEKDNKLNIRQLQRFFRSDYFKILSKLNPKVLLKKIKEEVKDDSKRIPVTGQSSIYDD